MCRYNLNCLAQVCALLMFSLSLVRDAQQLLDSRASGTCLGTCQAYSLPLPLITSAILYGKPHSYLKTRLHSLTCQVTSSLKTSVFQTYIHCTSKTSMLQTYTHSAIPHFGTWAYIQPYNSYNHTIHTTIQFIQPYNSYNHTIHTTIQFIQPYNSYNHTIQTTIQFIQPYNSYNYRACQIEQLTVVVPDSNADGFARIHTYVRTNSPSC